MFTLLLTLSVYPVYNRVKTINSLHLEIKAPPSSASSPGLWHGVGALTPGWGDGAEDAFLSKPGRAKLGLPHAPIPCPPLLNCTAGITVQSPVLDGGWATRPPKATFLHGGCYKPGGNDGSTL